MTKSAEEKLTFGSGENRMVVRVLANGIFNIRTETATDTLTTAELVSKNCSFQLEETDEHLTIKTLLAALQIEKETLLVTLLDNAGRSIVRDHVKNLKKPHDSYCYKEIKDEELFFALGEKTGFLNKKGERYRFWNYAEPFHFTPIADEMYQSIPFLICKGHGYCYGIYYDNSFDSFFDIGKENRDYLYFGSDGGQCNYYLFYGESVKEVVNLYTSITGRTALPPMWSLGYHQSRWSYFPDQRVLELARTFREKHIPCDSIHLDIDYMDNYKIFTFNEEKFPEPERFFDELNGMGFKMITIVDPGVKKEEGYKVYEQGAENGYYIKNPSGEDFVGDVWPGGCAFPDFTNKNVRSWWAGLNVELLQKGVKGIWNDLNEPSILVQPHTIPKDVLHQSDEGVKSHGEVHNLYANYEALATLEAFRAFDPSQRPFILSRAGFAGIQKYAAIWTGDNTSSWDQLLLSIPMFLNLGLSGVPFVGADVGGYAGDCSEELLIRWMQLGAFTPLFRNHSRKETVFQEPWAYGERAERIIKKFIELRYRLLPYFYSLFRQSHEQGFPILRPLFFDHESDKNTYGISDQFMIGEHILAAPVYLPGQNQRSVYLPEGVWYNYWTNEIVEGGRCTIEMSPLDTMPIFIKAGSVIPEFPVMNYVGEKPIEEITLHVYPGQGSFCYYEDDGVSNGYLNGAYKKIEFYTNTVEDLFEIRAVPVHKGFEGANRFRIMIHGMKNVSQVVLNNEPIEFTNVDSGLQVKVVNTDSFMLQVIN